MNCSINNQELAKELVELILSGFQLNLRTHCINQKYFKNVVANISGSEEIDPRADILFTGKDNFRITNIKTNEDGFFATEITWEWADTASNHPKTSQFIFRRYQSKSVQRKQGCGAILNDFTPVIVRDRCYIPLKKQFKKEPK